MCLLLLGHSSANLTQADDAINNGATLITHLFNTMIPVSCYQLYTHVIIIVQSY